MFLCLNNLCTSFVCTVNMCVWGVSLCINYTSGCLFGAKDDCSAFFSCLWFYITVLDIFFVHQVLNRKCLNENTKLMLEIILHGLQTWLWLVCCWWYFLSLRNMCSLPTTMESESVRVLLQRSRDDCDAVWYTLMYVWIFVGCGLSHCCVKRSALSLASHTRPKLRLTKLEK